MACCPHCNREFALADLPLAKRLKKVPPSYAEALINNIFLSRGLKPSIYWDKAAHTFEIVQARWAVWEQLFEAGYGSLRIAEVCGFDHSTIWHAKKSGFRIKRYREA